MQLPAHHHQPLHPYSKLSPSTGLASDDGEGVPHRRSESKEPRTGEWSSARHRQGPTKLPEIRPSIYVHKCSKTYPRLSSVDINRWDPTYHEVGVPLENRNRARPTDPRERACGQKERGHHEVGAATENFRRELGRVIVVVRQEYPPRHDDCGRRFPEASHLLLRTVWLGGVLIEDMATAGRGRSFDVGALSA